MYITTQVPASFNIFFSGLKGLTTDECIVFRNGGNGKDIYTCLTFKKCVTP